MQAAQGVGMGPLSGIRVLELAGIGPGPFAAMLLADLGAEVLRIQRPGSEVDPRDMTHRGKSVLHLDLRDAADRTHFAELASQADILIEGFRPGVMERLGFGPEDLRRGNPRLVYGRMTGWGQDGPLARSAGHDLTYIALSGLLSALGGRGEPPSPPLNLVGDYGGGALFLAFGLLAARLRAERTGRGDVVDAAILDSANLFAGIFHSLAERGRWTGEPGTNLIDGGAPFYNVYRCKDGLDIAVAPLEPQFHEVFAARLGDEAPEVPDRSDPAVWPELKARYAALFATRERDEWCRLFEGSDACVAPVLTFAEAPHHPQNVARKAYDIRGAEIRPRPAPRFAEAGSPVLEPPVVLARDAEAGWPAATRRRGWSR